MFSTARLLSKTKAALGAGLLLAVTSCSNFLDQDIRSTLTPGTYFANADQAQAAINGLYDNLRLLSSNTDTGYGESGWVGLELFAQHATSLGQSQYNNQILNQTLDAANPYFSSVWNNAYYGIAAANLCIARIPAITMADAQKKILLG